MLLDSGNFSGSPTAQGKLQTEALLKGMQTLGYSVINVGERDIKMGYQEFAARTGGSSIPFISANIVQQDTQQAIFPTHHVVEAASPNGKRTLRVGVTGVARFNPMFLRAGPGGANMVMAEPVARVRQALEALEAEGVDVVVLLAAMNKPDAAKIAAELPGIDFIVGAYAGLFTTREEKEGSTYILYSGNQGKRFGSTRVFLGPDGRVERQDTRMHFMTRSYPANQEMLDFVNSIPRKQKASARPAATPASLGQAPYVGSRACKSCHEVATAQWKTTTHARSFSTLEREGKSEDAACVSCHVTPTFKGLAATPQLAEVGCEACHGAGRDHVANTGRPYGKTEIATCTGCHDLKNSPNFDYYSYVDRVNHRNGSR